jgi:outer membrane protein TolC
MLVRLAGILGLGGAVAVCLLPLACGPRYHPSHLDTYVGPVKAPESPEQAADQVLADAAGKESEAAAPKTPEAETPAKPAQPAGPIKVNVHEAVLMAMEHNQGLAVERLTPVITRTYEGEYRGAFDPVLSAKASDLKTSEVRQRREYWLEDLAANTQNYYTTLAQARDNLATGKNSANLAADLNKEGAKFRDRLTELAPEITNAILAQVGVTQFFPSGATAGISLKTLTSDVSFYEPLVQTRLGLTLDQPLLRGFGADVNLARLRQARIDTLSSQYQLRGFAEALDGRVEEAFWDYALAIQQEKIQADGLAFAEKQLKDINERIGAGILSDAERAPAESEIALRRQDVIDALSAQAKARLRLVRLMNPERGEEWDRPLDVQDTAELRMEDLGGIASSVQTAMQLRPDLNQARLLVERDELEIVRTKNGLLPQLDLFFTVGKSGYGESIAGSWQHFDDTGYDLLFGLSASYPAGNHTARALYQRAKASRQQAAEAVANMAQLVEEDVRTAYVEVDRARQQVAASQATRMAMEKTLQAELAKYGIGRSTYLLVGRAERDVVTAQLSEATAAAAYRKALVVLYQMEGTLLERRAILAPGREPAEMAKHKGRGADNR